MRVLIADADPDFAKAVRRALRSESLVVELAAHADETMERALAVPYAALVLDLRCPGREAWSC